jgi:putative membrane protein
VSAPPPAETHPAGAGAVPERLHPLTPVLDLVVAVRQMAFPVVVIVLGGPGGLATLALLALLAAGVIALRAARWYRFTYRIDGTDLVIDEGILQRSRRVVPLGRIQQVDVQRSLRHQLFGVAVLRVDTAGGGSGAEAELDVLGLADAHRLRAELLDRRSGVAAVDPAAESGDQPGPPGNTPPPDPDRVVLEVPAWRLAVGGITGARLAVVLTVAASAIRLLEELPEGTAREVADRVPDTGPAATLLLVVALPVWFALAAGTAVLTDAGFSMTRRDDDLHVRRGLLDKREASTALHRVQVVRIEQNVLRRALGLASVQLQSAGSGSSASGDVSRITVPVMPVAELDGLLAEILPGRPRLPALHAAPPAARRRAILRRSVPATLAAVPLAALTWPTGAVVLLALPVAALAGELAWRGLGYATVPDHVVARRGGLLRETVVVPVAKAQSVRVRSSPLQRRAGLATLRIDVAGRGRTPSVADGPAPALDDIRGVVIGAPGARRDEAEVRRRARGG